MARNAAAAAVLPRADTPSAIAALAISSETAGVCLARRAARARKRHHEVAAVSCDELQEYAERFFHLAQVARDHHALLTGGRQVPRDACALPPVTWSERLRAWWQRMVREHWVMEAP